MRSSIIFLCLLGSLRLAAQNAGDGKTDVAPANFCTILANLIDDAGKSFRHTKGSLADSNGAMMTFGANQGLPGAASSNVVDDGVIHYEAIMYEGSSKEEMKKAYTRYKEWLDACLNAAGYESSSYDNEKKDMTDYPTISYGLHGNGSAVILGADQSDINGLYEVVISVNK